MDMTRMSSRCFDRLVKIREERSKLGQNRHTCGTSTKEIQAGITMVVLVVSYEVRIVLCII